MGIILGVNDEVKGYNVWIPSQDKIVSTQHVKNITPPTPRRDMTDMLDFGKKEDPEPLSPKPIQKKKILI